MSAPATITDSESGVTVTAAEQRDYYTQRARTLEQLEAEGKITVYPHKFHVTTELADFRTKYDHLTASQQLDDVVLRVAGRITVIRCVSAKLYFYKITHNGSSLQVMSNLALYKDGQPGFALMNETVLRRGDHVGVEGIPARSKTGELSIIAHRLVLLSPCYHMLPAPDTLTDTETRYRNRYLDMIVNERVAKTFKMRSQVVKYTRDFFARLDFIEVETPSMSILPGGASARPFVTHHNDLKTNMFMRIAPELFLKQCIIGGLPRVFEIGKNFRNEGVDMTHNPEFTAIEAYWAYADYEDLMKMTEDLIAGMVLELTGSYTIEYPCKDGVVRPIDFTPPFRRFPMIRTLEERLAVKFPEDLASSETTAFLRGILKERSLVLEEPHTTVRMLDKLVGEYIEPDLIQPGYIIDHPQIMSPLAKWHRSESSLTERFELFVAGRELCNAYPELNDPFWQRKMFQSEQEGRAAGDTEAQVVDEAFCESLEYGLPPTGGWGMGIDRLCMFLTNQQSIKEVILFPMMKPLEREREAQKQLSGTIKFALEQMAGK